MTLFNNSGDRCYVFKWMNIDVVLIQLQPNNVGTIRYSVETSSQIRYYLPYYSINDNNLNRWKNYNGRNVIIHERYNKYGTKQIFHTYSGVELITIFFFSRNLSPWNFPRWKFLSIRRNIIDFIDKASLSFALNKIHKYG